MLISSSHMTESEFHQWQEKIKHDTLQSLGVRVAKNIHIYLRSKILVVQVMSEYLNEITP